MAVTHGTGSAYNGGCRCDACREASRVARARQRAVARAEAAETWPGDTRSNATPGINLVILGLVLVAGGGLMGWQAWKTEIAEDATESERASRKRRLALGGLLLVAGAGCVAVSLS